MRDRLTRRDGVIMVVVSVAVCGSLLFWIVFSKLLPPSNNWLIEWMRTDTYYCLLAPIVAVPMSVFANYIRWLAHSLATSGVSMIDPTCFESVRHRTADASRRPLGRLWEADTG